MSLTGVGPIRLSVGVEGYNWNMATKTTGAATGVPDGWVPSTQWNTDVTAAKLVVTWEPLQQSSLLNAPPFLWGQGRALHIALKDTLVSDTTRYVESPPSRAGQMFQGEQMVSTDYWGYRVRFAFYAHYTGGSAPATGDVSLQLVAYSADNKRQRVLCSYDVVNTDWDNGTGLRGWTVRETAREVINTSSWADAPGMGGGTDNTPHHCRLRVTAKRNNSGVAGFVHFIVTHFTVECLGPVDTGQAWTTLDKGGTGAPVGYYELSHPPLWKSLIPTQQQSFRQQTRNPSGRQRTADISGGVRKRMFQYEHPLLVNTDARKLWALWIANTGFPTTPGSFFGNPLPLVLMPNRPNEVSPYAQSPVIDATYPPLGYYVDFDGPDFPIPGFDGGFEGATDADQLYHALLRFTER